MAKAKALWGGRFEKRVSAAALAFNSGENIQLDTHLIPFDIAGNLAHVLMLGEQKILSSDQTNAILKALLKIKLEYSQGRFQLQPELEDVHMNVETAVTQRTPHGKSMHVARSRNDQVLLDTRLYMRDRILGLAQAIVELQKAFLQVSKGNAIMPAYTHTRIAQPISTAFWAQAYVYALSRDLDRLFELYARVNQNPLGAGACSGTSWNISRKRTAELLGFAGVQENALDAISSRGELEAELLSILSLLMAQLSRLSEELIWFSEKGFLTIPEEFTTGSSMMPQKKNADVLELIRGRTARVYGNWMHVLVALKGLISGYNSDTQETKKALMEGIETAFASLTVLAHLVPGIRFNEQKMIDALDAGFAQATALADLLAQKGMPFREGHEVAGKLVRHCEKQGKTLGQLTLKELQSYTPIALSASELARATQIQKMNVRIDPLPIERYAQKIATEQKRIQDTYTRLYQLASRYGTP